MRAHEKNSVEPGSMAALLGNSNLPPKVLDALAKEIFGGLDSRKAMPRWVAGKRAVIVLLTQTV